MPVLQLKGCHYEPLGDYLKALGIFRLIAEQLDPTARCWWKDGIFHLWLSGDAQYPLDSGTPSRIGAQTTEADQQAWLREWFLKQCVMTPFPAVWQTGTGYLLGSENKLEIGKPLQKTLSDLAGKPALRDWNQTVVDLSKSLEIEIDQTKGAKDWFSKLDKVKEKHLPLLHKKKGTADEKKAEFRAFKNSLVRRFRNHASRFQVIEWLDAVAQTSKRRYGDESVNWFPLLGKTGAGENKKFFITNLLENWLPIAFSDKAEESSARKLAFSLFEHLCLKAYETKDAIGIFYPSGKDDPNLAQKLKGGQLGNVWNSLMVMEATPLLTGALSRKLGARRSVPAFPFYARASLGGSPQLSEADEYGGESQGEGELWMPLWSQPAGISDLKNLFSEGRIGTHGTSLTYASDFAQAISRFGKQRGIEAFMRYGIFNRSGSGEKASLIVLSLDIYSASFNPEAPFMEPLADFAASVNARVNEIGREKKKSFDPHLGEKKKEAPKRLLKAKRHFLDAYMEAHQLPSSDPQENRLRSFQVLVAASRFEREMEKTEGKLESDKAAIREFCLPSLKQDWLWLKKENEEDKKTAFDQNSPAFRLARALGFIQAWPPRSEAQDAEEPPRVGPIRENISAVLPKDGYSKSHHWKWEWPKEGSKANRCVWRHGLPFLTNCAAVLKRRMADADPSPNSPLPLWSGFGASLSDIAALWSGELDESELTDQLFAFSLIRSHDTAQNTDDRQRSSDPTIQIADAIHAYEDDNGRIQNWTVPMRDGKNAISNEDTQATFALPRAYALLKLCFLGGRMPPPPPVKGCRERTGHEPYPPGTLAILNLLLAGRGTEAVNLAARQLRARGYPTIHDPHGRSPVETLSLEDWRRLAGLLLIPTHQTGALASLVIKPNIER